jgi:ribonucleoside-diphosphate reductase alpha chain
LTPKESNQEKDMPDVTEKVKTTKSEIPPATKKGPGLQIRRLFTKLGVSPYNEVEWELRLAQITDSKGAVIFEQKDVEVPKDWSMTATNIVA